ncbi:MAG: ABC transporter permease [Deltaproteobacteria bacterium]|nr:ABC transporter permease [Deltaproteobacteria bacterium]
MRFLRLIFKNTLRHKLRTVLTVIGIAIAVLAFGLMRTVVTAWYAGVEASAANRLITRHAVSFILTLPYAYRDQIKRVPGVEQVTFANWFSGVYIDKSQFFARLAIDTEHFFDVYPEFMVEPGQLQTFKKERNACIIGIDIARRYNLKLGDVMPLEGDIYPGKWEFVVRGIYQPRDKTTDPSNMLFHWRNLDERVRKEAPDRAGQVGWYIVRIRNPDEAATVSEAIDQQFGNSRAETKSETERSFQQNFLAAASAIITAMNVVSFVIIGIIMLVLGNTMIMSARERTHEYAVLKALGFPGLYLAGLIAGESVLLSTLGGALGLVFTVPSTEGFQAAMPKGFFPVFYLSGETLLISATASILVGLAASLVPIQRVLTMKVVDGLRYIG